MSFASRIVISLFAAGVFSSSASAVERDSGDQKYSASYSVTDYDNDDRDVEWGNFGDANDGFANRADADYGDDDNDDDDDYDDQDDSDDDRDDDDRSDG